MAPGIFFFNILIFIYLLKSETIETHVHAFLTLNILAIGRVHRFYPSADFNVAFTVISLIVYLPKPTRTFRKQAMTMKAFVLFT